MVPMMAVPSSLMMLLSAFGWVVISSTATCRRAGWGQRVAIGMATERSATTRLKTGRTATIRKLTSELQVAAGRDSLACSCSRDSP